MGTEFDTLELANPGDVVLCIDDVGTNLVRKGQKYTVEGMSGNHFLVLKEIPEGGMSKYRFQSPKMEG